MVTRDDIVDSLWAMPFQQRCSILILSIVGLHRETAATIQAFARMSVKMSHFSNRQERVMSAETLRHAADEIERPALAVVD